MKQLTVITDAHKGLMAEITEALAANNINLKSLDAKSMESKAIIILVVDNYDLAIQVLNKLEGAQVISEDAILIRLKDEPGAVAKIARRFTDADIDLRSIRILQREGDYGLVAISTERTDDALQLVKDVLVS
ncbi:MAG: ACT domain-containing protein [Gammaproteobacteria bacterium]|nr:ACT domain-containing protein [Gammaproteobacteria bacterium]